MKNFATYVFLFVFMFIFGCVSDVDLTITGGDSKIAFYCEFEADQPMSFYYSSSTGLNDLREPINPEFTSEFLFTLKEDNTAIHPAFRYDYSEECFSAPLVSFTAKEGSHYSISSSLIDFPELPEINASTYIHAAKELNSLSILELKVEGEEFGYYIDMLFQFTVDPAHRDYEISAYVKKKGDLTAKEVALDINLLSTYPGVLYMPHRKSLLIDSKVNKSQFVKGRIETSIIDGQEIGANHVYFKIKTVTAAHNQYHTNMAKRIESNNAAISEPVVNFSNVENGLGLFSGYSSVTDSLFVGK